MRSVAVRVTVVRAEHAAQALGRGITPDIFRDLGHASHRETA